VTCIWEKLPVDETRMVTITANATTAGAQPSIAAVTTSSLDTEPNNNKAAAEVEVLVSAADSLAVHKPSTTDDVA